MSLSIELADYEPTDEEFEEMERDWLALQKRREQKNADSGERRSR